VHHADLAMYEAKRAGRGRHSFFRAEFNEQVQAQMLLERELTLALRRGEFVLHYQPQVGANDGALHGCEALIRWRHPQRGLVAPGAFIATAEQCGLIGAIGSWALGEACAQIARWKAAGVAFGRVAVNVSAAEFRQPALIETVQSAMRAHAVRPDELELEVTETVLMSDGDAALRVIAGLRALGLRIAVDDFGTGYSSLAYLKRLRPRTIKIDRSFLRDLPDDEEDRVVVLAILGLAQALGIEVVAEGVETEAQREFLRGARCDVLQGYLISRPVDATVLAAWLRERPPVHLPDQRSPR
jgi:EAL domain-containing protein (putative c-di-GMP-specific phosphodiesterase class I)